MTIISHSLCETEGHDQQRLIGQLELMTNDSFNVQLQDEQVLKTTSDPLQH